MIFLIFLLIPPLKGPLVPTSGFGEYRTLRFHTGVDFSTGGKEGLPVFAVEDGILYRIKVSYTDYGKALYLKLRDGRIVVYAHLLRFSPLIDSLVYFRQIEKRNYFIDLTALPQIKFKEGDLIGYSGQSGAGPPHLHFEFRTASNRPINPFSFLPLEDTLPPIMKSVTFIPRKKGSLVDGYPVEKTYNFEFSEGVYTLREIPNLFGNFGLTLNAHDRSLSRYHFPIYKVSLFIDGDLMYALSIDSIDFSQNTLSEIHYRLKCEANSHEIRLFHLDKIWLPQVFTSASSYKVSPGLHEILIEISDFANNVSRASFIIQSDESAGKGKFLEPKWNLVVEKDGEILALYAEERGLLVKTSGNINLELNSRPLNILYKEKGYLYYFLDEPGYLRVKGKIEKTLLGALIGKEGGCIHYGSFIFKVEKNSLPEPILFWITENPQEDYPIPSIGEPILILPHFPPTLKKFIIAMDKKTHLDETGIFRKKEKWIFVGDKEGSTRALGTFALLVDTIPPSFKSYRWKNGEFIGILLDNESGIDVKSIEFYLDGEWVPVDYDIETGILRFHPVVSVKRGFHVFSLKANDNLKNSLEQEIRVYVK